jgi:hypothetical protein
LPAFNNSVIRMKETLKRSWQETYQPPLGKSSLFMVSVGIYKRHWTSKAAHVVADFWLKYWQWCVGFGLAVIGLIWKH